MSTLPASASEAMDMVRAGLGYLAAADATAMAAETQARCLQMLEQANSMGTAARASILGRVHRRAGLQRGRGLQPAGVADQPHAGHQGDRGGLHRVGAAGRSASGGRGGAGGRGAVGVVRPDDLPWTDKLPEDCREDADAILLGAAAGGAELRDLAGLAAEIYARSLPEDPGKKQEQAFEDRSVRLETTFERRGSAVGGAQPGVRLDRGHGAGRAVGPGRAGG